MLPFSIHLQDGVPVSDQIEQAIRKAMLTGELSPNDEFPSVRVLSQELRISPTTAHKVVASLKSAGYLASRPGIGMVVIAPELPDRSQRLGCLKPLCHDLLKEARDLQLTLNDVIEAIRQASKETQLP